MQTPLVPVLADRLVRELFKPGGEVAIENGKRVHDRRLDLGFTLDGLATLSGSTIQTISRIEAGKLVPRDRLKAALAYCLMTTPDELWRYPSNKTLFEKAAS